MRPAQSPAACWIRRWTEDILKQLNAAHEFLQAGGAEQALFVLTDAREFKALSEVPEGEVVFGPGCESRNRLPARQHLASRCGNCSALLAVSAKRVTMFAGHNWQAHAKHAESYTGKTLKP